jgi:class 3 adenylate cyclase
MSDGYHSLECPTCSFKNAADAKFCESCGAHLVRICLSCGMENTPKAKFCKNCGVNLKDLSVPEPDTRLKTLQQTAPRGLQEKMRQARKVIEGERRPVTILFVDIVGSTPMAEKLDPEEWKEVVAGAHQRVSDAIYRYEGTIAQLLGDGVLAFFGAPITHEDDPIRAVHAALDIQDAIADYRQELGSLVDDFQMRIGIHSGTVVIGDIGTDLHMEYLAIGDAVNLAARLQSAAQPGKVLLSEASANLVKSAFDLKDLGEIEVKGKSQALAVFELEKAKVIPGSGRGIEGLFSPLVGREHEFEVLHSSVTSLSEGHGQIVTLLGDAGIGKTRLLEEVRALVGEGQGEQTAKSTPSSSIRWLEGRSLSYGIGLSFWTITQLFLGDLGLSDGAPEARIKVALRRRVGELFGEDRAEVLPFLFHLIGVKQEKEEGEFIQRLDSEALKRQVLYSVCEYFARVADIKPTVLVFEDMHWADPSTLEALGQLLAITDRVPLMILMIMRIDRDHGSWQLKLKAETDFGHRYREIHLKRLSLPESDQLVNNLLEIAELPKSIRDLIMARSEGNPFYLEEIIRSLIDQGVVMHEDNTWRAVREITEVTIPDTLHGVILARIDRLEEDVRSTLQMAAVIGKSFMYRLLEAIAEAEHHLDAHLAKLQRADLVREKVRWPDLEYIFKHSLTQEAAYNSLLIERRKIFHLRVGEAIETLFPDRREEFLGLLARHFEAAEANEKAVDYLLRAGDKARLEDALEEATDYYHCALKLLERMGDDGRASRTWLKIGLIHQTNFDFATAHKANEKAFALELKVKNRWAASTELDRQSLQPLQTLRFAVERYLGSLDPGKVITTAQAQIVGDLFAGLVKLDSETNVVPHVAHCSMMADAISFTCGMMFSGRMAHR